jgi:hypothetical protein
MTKDTKRTLSQYLNDLVELDWTAEAARRYIRAILENLPIPMAVAAIADLVDEERHNHVAYYGAHTPLLDDQLEHTFVRPAFC